jgi:hypothetical protein
VRQAQAKLQIASQSRKNNKKSEQLDSKVWDHTQDSKNAYNREVIPNHHQSIDSVGMNCRVANSVGIAKSAQNVFPHEQKLGTGPLNSDAQIQEIRTSLKRTGNRNAERRKELDIQANKAGFRSRKYGPLTDQSRRCFRDSRWKASSARKRKNREGQNL